MSRILQRREIASQRTLHSAQKKFAVFLAILENNNRVLKIIRDMEEKSQGDHLFDINYIRTRLEEMRSGVLAITDGMVALGGDRYSTLRERYDDISREFSALLREDRPVKPSHLLGYICPLNLIHPDDTKFTPGNCRTFHDIVRFSHQRAMEEMFSLGNDISDNDRIAFRLKTDLPLKVLLIHIGGDRIGDGAPRQITEEEIASVPLKAFWRGIKEEGWPSRPPVGGVDDFLSVVATGLATNTETEFSESSLALLNQGYMLLSLRMGYHFSTVESRCTDTVGSNYICFQCKGGGASLERRSRRIQLLVELLSRMGYRCMGKGDFIDARLSCRPPAAIADSLRLLGRITIMTKQLDMALSNDAIMRWYTRDFIRRLGMAGGENSCMRGRD